MKKNERLEALHILVSVVQNKTPLLHSLHAEKTHSPLTKALCFGVCRQFYRLEALADCLVKKRPKQMDVWLCLLMGIYELHYLRTPDYAVVKETVGLLTRIKKMWAKGLVNAVLRSYCREQEELLTQVADSPAFLYGHPDWFLKRVQADWPHHWAMILKANDEHPPMSLRVNAARGQTLDYLARLNEAGLHATAHCEAPQGLILTTPCDVHDLPGFDEGDVSVQDIAAQLAAPLLDLKPGLRVLDACCAPGGKTCHMLETEPHLASVVALDIEQTRLTRVNENLKRLHLKAVLLQGDGLKPEAWWDGVLFDRILLDAPCSATGVIRRHPDIKLLRSSDEITEVAHVQEALLKALWPLLAPNGRLVYATCSIMPQENEHQLARFVAQQADCEVVTEAHAWGHATGHGWQILPGEQGMDGFFYGVLRKVG